MKVYHDLLQAATKTKTVNTVRYMLALRQIGRGDGHVNIEDATKTLSTHFRVKPKTVLNRLHIAENAGFGNFNSSKTKFYYYSQVRMLSALGGNLTTNIAVDIDNFNGSVVEARAKFYAALLAARGHEVTVTRSTIHSRYGRTKRTQRKYEKIARIGKRKNIALLKEFNEYDFLRLQYLGYNVYIRNIDGTKYIAKQLANTYMPPSNLVRCKQKNEQPCIIVGGGNANRVYFNSIKRGLAEWSGKDDVYIYDENKGYWDWYHPNPLP